MIKEYVIHKGDFTDHTVEKKEKKTSCYVIVKPNHKGK